MYNLITMTYTWFTFVLVLMASSIGVLISGINEKKGLHPKAVMVFSMPDGSRASRPMDTGWSWTVYLFGAWALAFRGQFLEFMILFLSRVILISAIAFSLTGLDYDVVGSFETPFVQVFESMSTKDIVLWVIAYALFISIKIYYVAFANRNRLRAYYNRGVDLSQSPNLDKLYEFLGVVPRVKQEDLAPNVKSGQTHDYVVPEPEEEVDDYSTLTVNDLKLLLKSEGVPFPSTATKSQLLELVEKHIK